MTVEAVRGRARRRKDVTTEQAAIGEADANIFNCPRCARPLAVGGSRCAGCGLRMVAGIPLSRVAGFVAAGVMVGLLAGGGLVAGVLALTRPSPAQVTAPAQPIAGASAAPAASGAAAPVVDPAIPGAALAALRQSTTLNQRLLADAGRLEAAMRSARPSGSDIAPILRNLVATASFGERLASTVGQWAGAAAVSEELASFYASVGRVAEDGLTASVRNSGAYEAAGRRMLRLLDQIPGLDAASRALAATVSVELPPLAPAP